MKKFNLNNNNIIIIYIIYKSKNLIILIPILLNIKKLIQFHLLIHYNNKFFQLLSEYF